MICRYVSVYEPYKYLLSKEADISVAKFISKERPLREYVREIEKLKTMGSQVASLPIFVPMHLFLFDCHKINKVSFILATPGDQPSITNFVSLQYLIERSRSLAHTLISNIVKLNQKFNRGICMQYDRIVKRITAQSETTEELVIQQDFLDRLGSGELLDLRVNFHFRSWAGPP